MSLIINSNIAARILCTHKAVRENFTINMCGHTAQIKLALFVRYGHCRSLSTHVSRNTTQQRQLLSLKHSHKNMSDNTTKQRL